MAGYSGTPLPQKLGLKPGARFGLVAPPVTENDVRAVGLAAGLVDNKVCAIDDVWSGLRFVYRIVDRPKVAKRRRGPGREALMGNGSITPSGHVHEDGG